nr:MAG TPA: hypothetical protein [Crassvirales sp.]
MKLFRPWQKEEKLRNLKSLNRKLIRKMLFLRVLYMPINIIWNMLKI